MPSTGSRGNVAGYGVFRAVRPAAVGAPTGKRLKADDVGVIQLDSDRSRQMANIWNNVISLKQLG